MRCRPDAKIARALKVAGPLSCEQVPARNRSEALLHGAKPAEACSELIQVEGKRQT